MKNKNVRKAVVLFLSSFVIITCIRQFSAYNEKLFATLEFVIAASLITFSIFFIGKGVKETKPTIGLLIYIVAIANLIVCIIGILKELLD